MDNKKEKEMPTAVDEQLKAYEKMMRITNRNKFNITMWLRGLLWGGLIALSSNLALPNLIGMLQNFSAVQIILVSLAIYAIPELAMGIFLGSLLMMIL